MSRKLPIFYNALLLTCVNLLLRFVSTSFQVHISARIGPEGVGLLQLVMSVGGLALTAGMAGVRTATMYLTAEELGRKCPQNISRMLRGSFIYSILFSGTVAILLHSFAPVIAQYWIGNIHTVGSIRTFGFFLPLTCLCGCMTGYFTAANRISTLAVVEIFEQLCYMVVTMLALQLWAGRNPELACQSVIMGSGISACFTLMCLVFLRLREKPETGPRIPITSRLLRTAIPLALADDLKAGISTTENLMVPKRLALYPGELTPLAAFGTVCGMVFPIVMFPAAILFALAELLIPDFARCNAAGSTIRIRYLTKKSLKLAMLYGCACGGIIHLAAEPLSTSLYGSTVAGAYLKLYSLLIPMLYCDAIVDAMVKGLGQQTASVRYNILTSALDVALLFVLLPKYGMQGYFFSFLITHLINFMLSLRRLVKTAKVRIPFHIPALAISGWLAAICGASRVSQSPGRVVAFCGLYGSLLVLFGIVSRKDVIWLKGLIGKK